MADEWYGDGGWDPAPQDTPAQDAPQEAPVDDAPVDDAPQEAPVETEPGTEPDAQDTRDAQDTDTTDADTAAHEPDTAKAHGRDRKRKGKGTDPRKAETERIRRIIGAYETLSDPNLMGVAKALTGTGRDDRATQVAELADRRTRARVERVAGLAGMVASGDVVGVSLDLAADRDDTLRTLVQVLSALAPEAGLSRPSGDARRDLRMLFDRFPEGADVSALSSLVV